MAIAAAMLVAAVTPAVVSAQPKLAFGFNVDCTDGSSFFVNFGPPKNQGTAMHILGTHSILTSNGFEITTAINGELVDDAVYKPRGLTAVDQRGGGVTCHGGFSIDDPDIGHIEQTWYITGWVTPRG